MAVDTAAKRFSMLDVGLADASALIPDGTIGSTDRADLLGLYAGIPITVATVLGTNILEDGRTLYALADGRTLYALADGRTLYMLEDGRVSYVLEDSRELYVLERVLQ